MKLLSIKTSAMYVNILLFVDISEGHAESSDPASSDTQVDTQICMLEPPRMWRSFLHYPFSSILQLTAVVDDTSHQFSDKCAYIIIMFHVGHGNYL